MPIRANLAFASTLKEGPVAGDLVRSDSVASLLDFASNVSQGGVTLPDKAFGVEVVTFSVDNLAYVTAGGVVNLSARVNVDCKWDTTPRGRTDVSGPYDAAVTKEKFPKIVSDLTPRADGRATREKYWAKDLTERHEKFHATDDIQRARLFLSTAKAFLDAKTVTSGPSLEVQLRHILSEVRNNIAADSNTYYTSVGIGGEGRAYADGKASYQERADGVKARAVAENWTT